MATLDVLKQDIDSLNEKYNKEKIALDKMKDLFNQYKSHYARTDNIIPNGNLSYTIAKHPQGDSILGYDSKYVPAYLISARNSFFRALQILDGSYIPLGYGLPNGDVTGKMLAEVPFWAEWKGNLVPDSTIYNHFRWHGGWAFVAPLWIIPKQLLSDENGLVLNIQDRQKRLQYYKSQIDAKTKELSDSYINVSKENINKKVEQETAAKASIANKANVNSIVVVVVVAVVVFVLYKFIF